MLSLGATERLLQLAQSGATPPPEIIELKQQIEAETRVAEFHLTINGIIDMDEVDKIVKMKLQLDYLYGEWAEGRLG